MPRKIPRLTPEVQQKIVSYVLAGGFPEVAAEAAGVPRDVFARWLARGEAANAKRRYREFALAVRQAQAQARLGAEVKAREGRPLDWLRNGPGRETAERGGWTATAKPRADAERGTPLLQPEIQELFLAILGALAEHPDARAAVAAVLVGGRTDTGR